jgi:hypothetical protein
LELDAGFIEKHVYMRGEGDPEEDIFASNLILSIGKAEGDPF